MPEAHVTTTARIRLVIDLPNPGGTWGPECKLDQVYKQAADSARDLLAVKMQGTGVRIIESQVTAIFTTEPNR